MSSVLDFLFQGSPPPSVTKYGTSTQNIPQFMSDYTQGLLNKANAVTAEPYQAYNAPRIAGFTPDQLKAQQQTEASVGQFTPNISSALDTTQQALGYNSANAAAPALTAAGNINAMASSQPYVNAAVQFNPYAAGVNDINAATAVNAPAMAQPYANQAAQTFTGNNVSQYMDPYVGNVVDRIGQLAGRNLSENLLPAVGSNFIRAGQFGSTGQQAATGRALRDTQESALAAQNKALSDAYSTAGQLFGTDQARQAQLASTMGNLNLGQQQNLTQAGTAAGNLANQTMTGLANIGQQQGTLANAQQQNLGQLGQIAGNMSSQTLRDQLAAGAQTAALAQQGQAMNLKDQAALAGVGAEQQAQQQNSLNTAYQDFLNQKNYPMTQLTNMNNLIRGLPVPTSTTTTSTGPLNTLNGPSGLTQILTGLALPDALGLKLAEGGSVKRNPNRRSSRGKKRN